jgi:hypothetical protein
MKRHEVTGGKTMLLDVHESNRYRADSRYAAAALARSQSLGKASNKKMFNSVVD